MYKPNYFLVFTLWLSCITIVSSQNYSPLVAGVTTLQTDGIPGEMAATTATNSAAIAGKPAAAIAMASITATNGKMLTVAHEAFFTDNNINLANNLLFATNATNWLSPAGKKSILISSLHQEWANPTNLTTFANRAISNGYSVTNSNGAFTAANLTGVGVVVIGNAWGTITQAELDVLATHLQNGGGILALGLGWSWGGNVNDYPMNKVAALAGQRFLGGTNSSPFTSFYPNVLSYNLTQAQAVIDSITTAYPTNLAVALQPTGSLQDKWTAANSTLRTIVETTTPNSTERNTVYNFYKTQFNKRPNYFKKSVSFNKNTENFLGWSRENMFKIFRDALVLNATIKADIATTLGLTGRYLDIWNVASVLIADNNSLDTPQKEYLYQLYALIPTNIHNVGIMTFKDLIDGGVGSLAYANIGGVVNSYAINSFSNAIGAFSENQFPSDISAGIVDIFCAAAPHEVTHVIDAYLSKSSDAIRNRKNQLIAQAGSTDLQYLRSMVTGAFFQANPQEFMASIANQYQVDTKKVFQLARQRFDNNYKEPINQALFFAEIYAQTPNETYFYNTTLGGVLTRTTIPITKDAAGYINKLTIDGVTNNFVRDPANGNVLSYSIGTTSNQNYCASKGNLPWEFWINNIQFGTINNTSNKEGYGNFTSQTTNIAQGAMIPLSILPSYSWAGDPQIATMQWVAWIDWNNNGTFEASETVGSGNNTTRSVNVAVPATATLGITRLRIAMKIGGAPTACETFEKGEVEDYTVNITGGTSGTPNLSITNVTGPATATPGSQITLAVTLTNTGTAPTIPTKLLYRQNGISGTPLPLTNDTASIAPLATNETRVVNYTLRLNNPIYPPKASYISSYSSPFEFGDYAIWANTMLMANGEPDFGSGFKTFIYNISPIFPQANISVNVVPNKSLLQRGEKWNAVYSIKNNSNTLIKQVFFNLGTFNRLSRNFISPNFEVENIGVVPVNSFLKRTIGEFDRLGLDMFDLAAGETRSIRLDFSRILTVFDQGSGRPQDTTATGILEFPFVNLASNVVNTNTTVSASILISVGAIANLPDLTLTNLNIPTPSVQQGNILNFNFDLKNIGTGNATGNFNVKSFLSLDQTLSADDYQDGSVPTANYTAGLTVAQIAGAMSVRNTLATGQYYLILKADGDDQIGESNENNNTIVSVGRITVTSVPTNTNYCASKGIAPWELWVGNVTLGSINNTSEKFKDFSTLGYSDYTNLTTTVNKGQSYPLSITPALSWIGNLPNAYCRVWIDFNNNKTFETSELVVEKNNANPLAANILIPATAATGNVRMRVSVKWGSYPTACETFDRGEVEDYTLNIQGGTDPCMADIIPPVLSNCPQNIVKNVFDPGCQSFDWTPPTASDNCTPSPSISFISKRSNSILAESLQSVFVQLCPFAPSSNIDTIVYTATDAKGNSSKCSFELKFINQCQIQQTIGSLPRNVILTTTGNCAAYKWQVPSTYFPCQKGPTSYSPYGLISTNPTVTVVRTLPSCQYCQELALDSACFPIGRTILTYNSDTFHVFVQKVIAISADIALSITAVPSVYRQWANNNVRISLQNSSNQAFSDVKIEFPFPTKTVTGGSVTPSVGAWKEFCAGNIKCYEWNIPTLAANATATLDIPLFILDAVGNISGTAKLLASSPTDNNAANNSATITLTQSAPTARQATMVQKPTQLIPVVIQKITPTLTEGDVMIDVESLVSKEMHFYFYNLAGKLARTEVRTVQKGDNSFLFDFYQETQGVYMIQTDLGTGQGVPLKFVKF
jgi:hypothetical protein